jgi:hypothetical protein
MPKQSSTLAQQLVHIPYRDSKLTHILKDSLGGNSKTNIIVTLSPSIICLGETVSSLKFAMCAMKVKQSLVRSQYRQRQKALQILH